MKGSLHNHADSNASKGSVKLSNRFVTFQRSLMRFIRPICRLVELGKWITNLLIKPLLILKKSPDQSMSMFQDNGLKWFDRVLNAVLSSRQHLHEDIFPAPAFCKTQQSVLSRPFSGEFFDCHKHRFWVGRIFLSGFHESTRHRHY